MPVNFVRWHGKPSNIWHWANPDGSHHVHGKKPAEPRPSRLPRPFLTSEAEAARKAALPPECHLAPDDDPNWSQWHQVEGEFGLHWERETIEPSIPLIDLILPDI